MKFVSRLWSKTLINFKAIFGWTSPLSSDASIMIGCGHVQSKVRCAGKTWLSHRSSTETQYSGNDSRSFTTMRWSMVSNLVESWCAHVHSSLGLRWVQIPSSQIPLYFSVRSRAEPNRGGLFLLFSNTFEKQKKSCAHGGGCSRARNSEDLAHRQGWYARRQWCEVHNHTHKSARFPHGTLLKVSVLIIVTPITVGKCHLTQQVRMPSSLWRSGTCVHVCYCDISPSSSLSPFYVNCTCYSHWWQSV